MSLVSCIMATRGRRAWVPLALRNFSRQDWRDRELVIVDDGPDPIRDLVPDRPDLTYLYLDQGQRTIGAKTNIGIEAARGDILAIWDDDDYQAPGRLTYEVSALFKFGVQCVGFDRLWFYDVCYNQAWRYQHNPSRRSLYLCGTSQVFTRDFWKDRRYDEIKRVGQDNDFFRDRPDGQVKAIDDRAHIVAMIHPGNTSVKKPAGEQWLNWPVAGLISLIGQSLADYMAMRAELCQG